MKAEVTKEWVSKSFPEDVVTGANAESTEECAAVLCDALVELGFLATLDFSQAYDCMEPSVTMKCAQKQRCQKG